MIFQSKNTFVKVLGLENLLLIMNYTVQVERSLAFYIYVIKAQFQYSFHSKICVYLFQLPSLGNVKLWTKQTLI